jgi:hypothetical protein
MIVRNLCGQKEKVSHKYTVFNNPEEFGKENNKT